MLKNFIQLSNWPNIKEIQWGLKKIEQFNRKVYLRCTCLAALNPPPTCPPTRTSSIQKTDFFSKSSKKYWQNQHFQMDADIIFIAANLYPSIQWVKYKQISKLHELKGRLINSTMKVSRVFVQTPVVVSKERLDGCAQIRADIFINEY